MSEQMVNFETSVLVIKISSLQDTYYIRNDGTLVEHYIVEYMEDDDIENLETLKTFPTESYDECSKFAEEYLKNSKLDNRFTSYEIITVTK